MVYEINIFQDFWCQWFNFKLQHHISRFTKFIVVPLYSYCICITKDTRQWLYFHSCWLVSFSVCLYVCMSANLSVCLPVCLSLYSLCVSVSLICLPVSNITGKRLNRFSWIFSIGRTWREKQSGRCWGCSGSALRYCIKNKSAKVTSKLVLGTVFNRASKTWKDV